MTWNGERSRGTSEQRIGRYTLLMEIASGPITSVYLARQRSEAGFSRLVAFKRLKPLLARQTEYVDLLTDEARIGAGLNHANLVAAIDAGHGPGECYVVLDYVEGDSLAGLLRRAGAERHPRFLAPLFVDALSGLHTAHTSLAADGTPMALVHQAPRAEHLLVGVDGICRVADFGQVASPLLRPNRMRADRLRVSHMAPEQVLQPDHVDHRADLFILGIALWESLTGERLFEADTEEQTFQNLLHRRVPLPSEVNPDSPPSFDSICMVALERNPDDRYASAADMARELRDVAINHALFATDQEIGQWVKSLCGPELLERRRLAGGDSPSQQIRVDDGSDSGFFESRRLPPREQAVASPWDEAPTSLHPGSIVAGLEGAATTANKVSDGAATLPRREQRQEDSGQLPDFSGRWAEGPDHATNIFDKEEATRALQRETPWNVFESEDASGAEFETPTRSMPGLGSDSSLSGRLSRPSRRVTSAYEEQGDLHSDSTQTPAYGVHHSVVEDIVREGLPVPPQGPVDEAARTRPRRDVREEGVADESSRKDSQPQGLRLSAGPVGDVFVPSAGPAPRNVGLARLSPGATDGAAYEDTLDGPYPHDGRRARGALAWLAAGFVTASAALALVWLLSADDTPPAPAATAAESAQPSAAEDADGTAEEAARSASAATEESASAVPAEAEDEGEGSADDLFEEAAGEPPAAAAADSEPEESSARSGEASEARPRRGSKRRATHTRSRKRKAARRTEPDAAPSASPKRAPARQSKEWPGRGAIPDNPF